VARKNTAFEREKIVLGLTVITDECIVSYCWPSYRVDAYPPHAINQIFQLMQLLENTIY